MTDNEAHRKKMLHTQEQRLRVLEEQRTRFGLHCPAHIIVEINEIRSELGLIQTDWRQEYRLSIIFANDAYMNQIIEKFNRSIRFHLFIIGTLIAVGVVSMTVLSYLLFEYIILWTIGGIFVISLSTLQLEKISTRKERVGAFETIKFRIHTLEQAPEGIDIAALKRIDDLLLQVVEKTVLG
jgi:hypothetical protein